MSTQYSTSPSATQSRLFRVGVIGANPSALAAFNRIFSVTRYRVRAYEAIAVPTVATDIPSGIDILLLCSSNPNVVTRWYERRQRGELTKPIIRLAKASQAIASDEYLIAIPLNPSRLLKTLDDYTIKELKFFPELEIGNDEERVSDETLAGIRLLKGGTNNNPFANLESALVVDDSLPVRKQIEFEFRLMGVAADLAESAEVAITQLQQKKYDIIFLDVVMPGMDGYAACKRIRKLPNYQAVPIVLLTSRSSSFDKLKGALAGCDTYLVKPINHNDFEAVLQKHFEPQGDSKYDNQPHSRR